MPVPQPAAGESQDEFIGRCMGDDGMQEYEQDQRSAICFSTWREGTKAFDGETAMMLPPAMPVLAEPQPRPYGGATSFADADAFVTAADEQYAAQSELAVLAMLMENIRADTELDAQQKIDAITALVNELSMRVDEAVTEAGSRATTSDPGSVTVFRDKSGSWRWAAVHSNRYEDREREIFPEAAHKAWVERVWRTKEFPALRLWHMPVDIGRADFVDYDSEGFVVSSGTFNPGMEDVAQRLAGMKGLGCSHGYLYRGEDLQNGVYRAYRTYEVSVLPQAKAANLLTAFFAGEEIPMLTAERKQFLVAVMGEKRANEMEAGIRSLSALAKTRHLSYKDLEEGLLDATAQEVPCPVDGEMIPAGEMVQHLQDAHAMTPDEAAAAAATVPAPGAAAPPAADAAPPPADSTVPVIPAAIEAPAAPAVPPEVMAVQAAASAAMQSATAAQVAAEIVTAAALAPEPEPVLTDAERFVEANGGDALEKAFKSAVSPLLDQLALMKVEIAGLKVSRDADIADRIRPRVGPDTRAAGRSVQSSDPGNIISAAEAARVKAAFGSEGDALPGIAPAKPYVADLVGLMRNGLGQH